MTRQNKMSMNWIGIILLLGFFVSSSWAKPPAGRKGRRARKPDNLKVGDVAPDFQLKSPDGKKEVKLSDYQGKKPVALVFGSYT